MGEATELIVTIALHTGSKVQVPNVGINGFGRIGRALFRLALIRTDINLVAVNHTALSDEHLFTAIKHDSTHGPCPQAWEITIAPMDHPDLLPPTLNNPNPSGLLFRGRLIHLFSQRDASKLDWASAGVHTVLESTGRMTTKESAGVHIKLGGAERVIISAPSKDAPNIVYGVNHHTISIQKDRIISNASCTTNCLAPIALVLHRAFGIETGMLTTIHASTASQHLLDGFSKKDVRQGRSAASNIIPTTTGAASAVVKVLPELAGKFHGISIRVPVTNVSLVDLTVTLSSPVYTKEELINAFRYAANLAPNTHHTEKDALAKPSLAGVLSVSDEKLVSSDYLGYKESSIVDADATSLLNERTAKIVAWYDNEVGFASRMCDLAVYLATAE